MHPCNHAQSRPDTPALIMSGSGEIITFKQLDERSNRIAHALRAAGCAPGDTIAIFAENSPRYFEICWAAQRAGLNAHELRIEDAHEDVRRVGRVGQGHEDVEDGANAQLPAHRRHILHRRVMRGRKHEGHTGLCKATRDGLGRQGDVHTQRFQHVGTA
jgi:hypothetical protein